MSKILNNYIIEKNTLISPKIYKNYTDLFFTLKIYSDLLSSYKMHYT